MKVHLKCPSQTKHGSVGLVEKNQTDHTTGRASRPTCCLYALVDTVLKFKHRPVLLSVLTRGHARYLFKNS